MKLEYIYYNNSNVKYTIKMFSLFWTILGLLGMALWNTTKIIDKSYQLMWISTIAISVIFCNILFYIVFGLRNKHKRKQFINIKENGNYYKGIILTAGYQSKGSSRNSWLKKDTGEISVEVNNKVYKIKGIILDDKVVADLESIKRTIKT